MEEFLQLNWGIKEPHELDYGPCFIPEDEISLSYIYTGLQKEELPENLEDITNDNSDKKKKPMVPGQTFNFKTPIRSFLNTNEHAKCLIALSLLQAGKKTTGVHEQNCMTLYNNSLERILKENDKFLKFAKEQFLKNGNKIFKFKSLLKDYSVSLWKHKLNRSKNYRQFYKGLDILPYSYKEDEEPIEMLHVQNILELGTLARFSEPTLIKPYHLKRGCLPKRKVVYNSNQPISKDQNIDKLIEAAKINVVISSSGLKKLINFTKANNIWDIPVVVKEYHIQNENGSTSTKNVVFIDKSLPSKSPTVFELNEQCFKTLLKTNFCDTKAFSFDNTETPIGVQEIYIGKEIQTRSSTKIQENQGENVETLTTNGTNKRKIETSSIDENNKKVKIDNVVSQDGKDNKMHHNVSYRLWKLQLKNEQCELIKTKYHVNNIQVLVRSKLDGCESLENNTLQPVCIVPKVEYHLEYGAGLPTKDELINEWVYAYFRPFSHVRRVRTQYNMGEVVAIENCNVQKITFEVQSQHRHNVHLGFGVMYKILSRLIHLAPGNYLLRHIPKDGAFVQLLQESSEIDGIYNLYKEYDINNCNLNTCKIRPWRPLDVNFILPKHRSFQHMPGMFKPCLPQIERVFKKSKKKKKKKRKPNNGRKIAQQQISPKE